MDRLCAASALARSGLLLVGMVAAVGAAPAQAGETFDAVKARGELVCGVAPNVPGFAAPDKDGHYHGLDVDICRSLAAALFGDSEKVKYVPLTAQERFKALSDRRIDVLSRNSTWTLSREANNGFWFGPVTFYDGQGFLVAKKSFIRTARQLSSDPICFQSGATTEDNLIEYFRAHDMELKVLKFDDIKEAEKAFFDGKCLAYTTDASGLAGIRAVIAAKPEDYAILPERISKEPLAPVVRQGDDKWYQLLRWTVMALIEAEELEITSENVDDMLKSADATTRQLLGVAPGVGKALGVDDKWAYTMIKQVGNYGEIYERNIGQDSPLKVARGLNDLWTNGGLMYAAPVK